MTEEESREIVAHVNEDWACRSGMWVGLPLAKQEELAALVVKQTNKEAVCKTIKRFYQNWLWVAIGPMRQRRFE